jgi:periplasmic copper chaperone A
MKKQSLILLVLVLLISACAPDSSDGSGGDGMVISDVSVISSGGDSMGMGAEFSGYMKIKNTSRVNDRLIGVTSDMADAMLHQTVISGDVASMKPVAGIDIPAGATVELKSGSFHIMFMNMKKDLKIGDTVNLTLSFEKAGPVTVTAPVTSR